MERDKEREAERRRREYEQLKECTFTPAIIRDAPMSDIPTPPPPSHPPPHTCTRTHARVRAHTAPGFPSLSLTLSLTHTLSLTAEER